MGLTRKRQIAGKIETTEGTVNAPGAGDAGVLVYEPSLTHDSPLFQRTPARASLSTLPGVPGIRSGSATFRVELRGSGTATTAPSWGEFLKACGMRELDYKTITRDSGTGTFAHGTTVTQQTSGATGVVIKETDATSATDIKIAVTSGTFNATNVIDDDFTSATFTPTGTVADTGIAYLPDSDATTGDNSSLTLDSLEDGIRKRIRGARGTFGIVANAVGEPVFLEFEFQGVEEVVDDSALLTGVTYETTQPPSFKGISFSINDGSAYSALISSITINKNSTLAQRLDANQAEGIQSIRITNNTPGGSVDPEAVTVATHDFYNNWFAGTTYTLGFTLGSTAGNSIEIFCGGAQSNSVGDGDRDGQATSPLEFSCHTATENSPGDDELVILHI